MRRRDLYIIIILTSLCLRWAIMHKVTDTREDFNDSENRDGLTVVLAHTFQIIIYSIYIPIRRHA